MIVFYSDHYPLPLPTGHRFPGEKYSLLRELLLREGILDATSLKEAPLASWEDLRLVHDANYLRGVETGTMDPQQWKRTGFPWSNELVLRCRGTVGGLIAASKLALEEGFSGNLAGGTHHAHRDRGEGYCVFNDIAVAAQKMFNEGCAQRIAIVDLDVHQGNGTATIFTHEPRVFTLSIHGRTNFPFQKAISSLDIPLDEGTGDEAFLSALEFGMKKVEDWAPDFMFFQMGVDGLQQDKLGKWRLTHAGLMERDKRVLGWAKEKGIPIVLALGGGYSNPIQDSVEAYANTYRMAKEIFGA
jgi:acetoin utilization deacetylase AcuC-like enzyme